MKKFRKIYIEITNICNMHCSFCPETKRAKATMSVEDFEYVINQVAMYTDYVYLHVKGEPLIHKDIEKLLDTCKKYNLQVNISTNGTLLKSKVEKLTGIRQLNISLHSFENLNELSLKEYLTDVVSSSKYLEESGVIIRYKLWNDDENKSLRNKIALDFLEKEYNVKIESSIYNKDVKLGKNTYLSIKHPFVWPDITGENQKETTCYGLRGQIAILVDGTVVPCCVDNNGDIAIGNIFDKSIEEILSSKKALEIKEGFEQNKCIHPLCKKCQYRIYVT